ncbi:MAG: phosphatase PAP2 family protein [Deltaproteobacteria bacterium]|nr:phosphatase PAP2 family protein [Deltaproteobacteria bacterium]
MDTNLLLFINHLRSPLLDEFFLFITNKYNLVFIVIPLIIALLLKFKRYAFWIILAMVIAAIVSNTLCSYVLKPFFGRVRPCMLNIPDFHPLLHIGSYSFPSNHAANIFTFATVLYSFWKRSAYFFYPLAFLVSIGRVYEGVHFPADVLAGAIFGIIIALIISFLFKKIWNEDTSI